MDSRKVRRILTHPVTLLIFLAILLGLFAYADWLGMPTFWRVILR